MARINLTGGAYQARSLAVAAQRCLNLIPEPLPAQEQEPVEYAYYPMPGSKAFAPRKWAPCVASIIRHRVI